jgi:low affinity Fe/Cu permease
MADRRGPLERFSALATRWSGSSWAFASAIAIIIAWIISGPFFHYSDTWQLVINTGTTIVTFLMVFLIQRAQNKDSQVIQIKLNEIVAALEGASNRLVDVEDLSEEEVAALRGHYKRLAKRIKHDSDLRVSHSIEETGQPGKSKVTVSHTIEETAHPPKKDPESKGNSKAPDAPANPPSAAAS